MPSLNQTLSGIPGVPQIKSALYTMFSSVRTGVRQYSVTLSPAIVGANTTAEQTFTVTGVAVGDAVFVCKPTAQAGIGIVGVRASAANQIGITFSNNTAGGLTPTASQVYFVFAFTPTALTA
jgi:hypothetical protein